jgi:hypothetical protein
MPSEPKNRSPKRHYADWAARIDPRSGPRIGRQADPVIEVQLEKAGVRLANLLNDSLH